MKSTTMNDSLVIYRRYANGATKEQFYSPETIEAILNNPTTEAHSSLLFILNDKSYNLSDYINHIAQPQSSKPIKRLSNDDKLQVIELLGRGLSVRKVAKRLGCSKSSISRINLGLAIS